MKSDILIQSTLDGSNTLYVPALDEHYHSVNGAIQESQHVFINAGLIRSQKQDLNILEIGFGTGLNAYLTYKYTKTRNYKIFYAAFELYPLQYDIIDQLNYTNQDSIDDKAAYKKLHESIWDADLNMNSNFILHKIKKDFSLLSYRTEKTFDLIFYDAFAPDKQPEMWTQNIFNFLYTVTNKDGILTTYCAKGMVRRMMQQAGYSVERIPGPPGKREMLRALKK